MPLTKTNSYLLIFISVFIVGCTIKTTKIKDPVFKDMNKFQKELAGLVTAENVNFSGKETTTNKKASSSLEVSITNGQNIPISEDERRALAKSIATVIKTNLKDSTEFGTYMILFVIKVENGGVTKRNWVGNIFTSKEL
jgi:hypothetical protein